MLLLLHNLGVKATKQFLLKWSFQRHSVRVHKLFTLNEQKTTHYLKLYVFLLSSCMIYSPFLHSEEAKYHGQDLIPAGSFFISSQTVLNFYSSLMYLEQLINYQKIYLLLILVFIIYHATNPQRFLSLIEIF